MANDSLAKTHSNEAVNLFLSTTVKAIFYTSEVILYYLSFRLAYAQFQDDHGKIKRQPVCIFVLATVLLICATLDVIISNRIIQVIYIDNRTLPGGPLGLPATLSIATLLKLDGIVSVVEISLALGVLLWRVWVIFTGTPPHTPITIVSVFLYLESIGWVVCYNAMGWKVDYTTPISRVDGIINLIAFLFPKLTLALMGVAISMHLQFLEHFFRSRGNSDAVTGPYLGLTVNSIESYALASLWIAGSVFAFSPAKYTPTVNLFNACAIQVDILTCLLVIYQVLSGHAWTRETHYQLIMLLWISNGANRTTSRTINRQQRNNIPGEDPLVLHFGNSA